MEGTDFDEGQFFGAIARSGARALRPKDLEDIRLLEVLRSREGRS